MWRSFWSGSIYVPKKSWLHGKCAAPVAKIKSSMVTHGDWLPTAPEEASTLRCQSGLSTDFPPLGKRCPRVAGILAEADSAHQRSAPSIEKWSWQSARGDALRCGKVERFLCGRSLLAASLVAPLARPSSGAMFQTLFQAVLGFFESRLYAHESTD